MITSAPAIASIHRDEVVSPLRIHGAAITHAPKTMLMKRVVLDGAERQVRRRPGRAIHEHHADLYSRMSAESDFTPGFEDECANLERHRASTSMRAFAQRDNGASLDMNPRARVHSSCTFPAS